MNWQRLLVIPVLALSIWILLPYENWSAHTGHVPEGLGLKWGSGLSWRNQQNIENPPFGDICGAVVLGLDDETLERIRLQGLRFLDVHRQSRRAVARFELKVSYEPWQLGKAFSGEWPSGIYCGNRFTVSREIRNAFNGANWFWTSGYSHGFTAILYVLPSLGVMVVGYEG